MVSAAIACARCEPSANTEVDIDRILHQLLHLGADRAELGNGEIDQRVFESRKLPAAKLAKHLGFTHALQRRVDADQVVSLGSRGEPFSSLGSGSGSVLALRIFWAMVSASSVRLMRE